MFTFSDKSFKNVQFIAMDNATITVQYNMASH